MIDFKDWKKLDIRVGKILNVEEILNADKLYKLEIDIGEKRTIVAGIKKDYSKEELKGKSCVVLANLQPKKLRGVESRGMILAAVDGEKVVLLSPEKKVRAGSKVE